MGTAGMRASLASREVIADSIELVCDAPHVRRGDRDLRLRQDDPRHRDGAVPSRRPGRHALRRLDRPRPLPRASDVTIQEVFEAVGAHAAGTMTDAELDRARGRRLPRRRRLRRAVHRQHDGDGVRGARHLAGRASSMVPADESPTSPRSPREAGRLVMDVLAPRTCARATSSPATRSRTRSPRSPAAAAPPTASCTCSRSRSEIGRRALDRRLRPDQRAHAAALRPEAGRRLRRPRPVRGRRRPARAEAPEAGRAARTSDALTVTGRTLGEIADGASETPRASASCGRSTTRSSPNGGLAILRGNLAPGGLRRQARRPRAPPADRARRGLRVRGGRDGGRHRPRRSSRAT